MADSDGGTVADFDLLRDQVAAAGSEADAERDCVAGGGGAGFGGTGVFSRVVMVHWEAGDGDEEEGG